jgi:hypothetical protein
LCVQVQAAMRVWSYPRPNCSAMPSTHGHPPPTSMCVIVISCVQGQAAMRVWSYPRLTCSATPSAHGHPPHQMLHIICMCATLCVQGQAAVGVWSYPRLTCSAMPSTRAPNSSSWHQMVCGTRCVNGNNILLINMNGYYIFFHAYHPGVRWCMGQGALVAITYCSLLWMDVRSVLLLIVIQ